MTQQRFYNSDKGAPPLATTKQQRDFPALGEVNSFLSKGTSNAWFLLIPQVVSLEQTFA
jgi:hypothetical protein